MFHSLQQDHLIVHHFLVAFDVLLENDLDSISFSGAFCFPDDAVCPCTQRPAESILRSELCVSTLCNQMVEGWRTFYRNCLAVLTACSSCLRLWKSCASAYFVGITSILRSSNVSRILITKYGVHTVSGPPGVRRVEHMTLLLWVHHVDVFPEQRGWRRI